MTEKEFVPAAVVFLHAICGDTEGTKKITYKESSPDVVEKLKTDGKFDASKAENMQMFFCASESAGAFEQIFGASQAAWIETTLVVKIAEKDGSAPAKGERITVFFYPQEETAKIKEAMASAAEGKPKGEISAETLESCAKTENKSVVAFRKLTNTEIEYVRRHAGFKFGVITEKNGFESDDLFSLYVTMDNVMEAQALIKEATFIWGGRSYKRDSSDKKYFEIMSAVVDTSKSIIVMNTSGNGEYSYITKDGASIRVMLDETVEFNYIPRGDGFDQKVFDVISDYYKPDFCDAREYEQTQKLPDIIHASEIEIAEENDISETASEKIMQAISAIFLQGATRIVYIKKRLEKEMQSKTIPELIDIGEAYQKIPAKLAQKIIISLNSLYNYSMIEKYADTEATPRRKFFETYLALGYLKRGNQESVNKQLDEILEKCGFTSLSKKDESELRKRIIDSTKEISLSRAAAYERNVSIRDDLEKQRIREEEFGRDFE